jgi:hypothetical protein
MIRETEGTTASGISVSFAIMNRNSLVVCTLLVLAIFSTIQPSYAWSSGAGGNVIGKRQMLKVCTH